MARSATFRKLARCALAIVLFACLQPLAVAQTLRWATAGDSQTLDPHAQNDALTQQIANHIYDSLVDRDHNLDYSPQLAERWEVVNDRLWRFHLRRGVTFHDGTPLTAEDVVFSLRRAQHPNSNVRVYANALGEVRKVDDHTIEFAQPEPNPALLQHLTTLWIMSRAWAQRHRVSVPLDFKSGEQSYASLNTNGTGPFVLKSRKPGVETVLTRNPRYWKPLEGNVQTIIHRPVANSATRMAALASGEIDLVQDPSPQDIPRLRDNKALKVIEGVENRIIFVGMDQARPHLESGAPNPFRDRRVREALYRAIDIDALHLKVMRGLARPTGGFLPRQVAAPPAQEPRLPFDLATARRLLAEAGFPDGFDIGMDCPNNRYVNDGPICQALAAMWAKAGIRVKLNLMPQLTYWPKLEKHDTRLYLMGWGGASTDAQTTLDTLLHSQDGAGRGDYNYGRIADPELDRLIRAARHEMNTLERKRFVEAALERARDRLYYLPLHRQVTPWAMRASVQVPHRADNVMPGWWVMLR